MYFLKQGGYPKFRFSTQKRLSETVNPIKYEILNYNDQMEYNNGVILIMQPGWYTFTASIRGPWDDNSYSYTKMSIMVDNLRKTYCSRLVGWLSNAVIGNKNHFSKDTTCLTTYSQYFRQFQLVQGEKSLGLNRAHVHTDFFEGRMIP